MPEIVEEIPDFIELKAVIAALLMLLLRVDTVDFMAFQPEETTDLMPFTTPEILLLMAVQMEETLDWIAERTVEMTVLIAFHAVLIRVWMPVSSGDRNGAVLGDKFLCLLPSGICLTVTGKGGHIHFSQDADPSPLSSGRKGSASASASPRCSAGCTACPLPPCKGFRGRCS